MTRLGVVGWPIAHSRSPAMQSAALHALGLDWTYDACAVAPDELRDFLQHAAAHGFAGVNVTIPHKEAALAACTPDALAAEVGAVNTLVFGDGEARGFNTDVHGFATFAAELGALVDGGSAVLLGAGGAARAVLAALHGKMRTAVVARHPRTLTVGGHAVAITPWTEATLAKLLERADLVVDATPRGLDPTAPPLDLGPLPAHAVVLDLVVARDTALTTAAKARGLRASAGAPMLLHQGARALEMWTERPAPIDVMRAALDAAL